MKFIEGMHGVEPCLGQTLCALSVPRPASPFGETIFTDSLNLSIFNLKKHILKTFTKAGMRGVEPRLP